MGQEVETLSDLLRPRLRAVCVGINPAPVSVKAGHYYQGTLGGRLWERWRGAGLVPSIASGWEDDAAFANGVGFTDIVKRPTTSESEIRSEEYMHGRALLAQRLEVISAKLVIFSFKKAAERYFGRFEGNGLLKNFHIAGASVFVMPGPYEKRTIVAERLTELRESL